MKAVLQRVGHARVEVADEIVGSVGQGLLVLVGVEPQDTQASADKLLHKLLNYRVFSDDAGKMNLSLKDVGGGLLLVSQFTLAADTAAACARAFPPPPRRRRVRRCSTIYISKPARSTRRSLVGALVRICRCIWSMTGR